MNNPSFQHLLSEAATHQRAAQTAAKHRDDALVELTHLLNDHNRWMTLEDIGRAIGVTREQVRFYLANRGARVPHRGKQWRPL